MLPGNVLSHFLRIPEAVDILGLQRFLGFSRSKGNSQSHCKSMHSGASLSPLSFAYALGWHNPVFPVSWLCYPFLVSLHICTQFLLRSPTFALRGALVLLPGGSL